MRLFKFHFVALLLLIAACADNQDDTEIPVFLRNKTAEWIRDDRPLPARDSQFYLDQPAPLFRKEFKPESAIENARLFITAAGYYTASINGKVTSR